MADPVAAALAGAVPASLAATITGEVGNDPHLDLAALPDPRRSYPRLAAVLTGLALPLIVATAADQVAGGFAFRDIVLLSLVLLTAAALATRLPWTGHDDRWLALIVAIQIVFVACLTTMTGGGTSPYFALYAPILALAGWYLRADVVIAAVTLVATTEIWRAVAIERGGDADQVTIALPFFAGLAAISWLTAHRLSAALATVRHDQVRTADVLEGVRTIGAESGDDPIAQLVSECERIFNCRAGIVTFHDGGPVGIADDIPMTGSGGYLRIPVSGARGHHGLLQLWREESFAVNEVRLAGILAGAAAKAADGRWLLDRVREESERDALTGLLNRRAFDRDLATFLSEQDGVGPDTAPTLFFLDVDGFKDWNDAHGHAEGDRLLQRLAESLLSVVRHHDHVYRYGGDEFAIVAMGLAPAEADAYAERLRAVPGGIRARRSEDGTLAAGTPAASLSVGVARADVGSTDAAELLRVADAAMYAAKRRHRSATANAPIGHGTNGPSTPHRDAG